MITPKLDSTMDQVIASAESRRLLRVWMAWKRMICTTVMKMPIANRPRMATFFLVRILVMTRTGNGSRMLKLRQLSIMSFTSLLSDVGCETYMMMSNEIVKAEKARKNGSPIQLPDVMLASHDLATCIRSQSVE